MTYTNLFTTCAAVALLAGCAVFDSTAKCTCDPCACGKDGKVCECGKTAKTCTCNPCACGKDGKACACGKAAAPAAKSVHPDSKAWMPLFNADLGNAQCDKSVWSVDAQGVMTANKDDAIWTNRDYENFILDLEYKYDPAANSGVVIYCSDMANWIPNAVEIQILDDNDPHWKNEAPHAKNGGLYGHLPPKVNNGKPAGEWNRMTVTAKGKHIIVAVNGEITVDADLSVWTDAKKNPDGTDIPPWLSRPWAELPTKGRIGLQGKHGNAAPYFRNIKIKEL